MTQSNRTFTITKTVALMLAAPPWLGLAAPAHAAYPTYNGIGQTGPYAWAEQANVVYDDPSFAQPTNSVNICRPVASGSLWQGPFPAVLLIHGGGWTSGSNATGTTYSGTATAPDWCDLWASWGFVAYSVGYRLIDGLPFDTWPAALADAQAAVRFVRARATGANPDHVNARFIGAMGEDAGGSLALQVGSLSVTLTSAAGFPTETVDAVASNNPGLDPQVQFVIAQNPRTHSGPLSDPSYSQRPGTIPSPYPLPYQAIAAAEPSNGGTYSPANSLFLRFTHQSDGDPFEAASLFCYLKGHRNPTNYLTYAGGTSDASVAFDPLWQRGLGQTILATISFAVAAGHYAPAGQTPPIPFWVTGPKRPFNDAVPPPCPYGYK